MKKKRSLFFPLLTSLLHLSRLASGIAKREEERRQQEKIKGFFSLSTPHAADEAREGKTNKLWVVLREERPSFFFLSLIPLFFCGAGGRC